MNTAEQFALRCKTATDCLPEDRYKEHLERLHRDMLEALSQQGEPVAEGFDVWMNNPYTKELQKSIAEDYVPKPAQQPLSDEGVQKLVIDYWGAIPPAVLMTAEVEFVRAIERAHGIGGGE